MLVLIILSDIWRSGADVVLQNGDLDLINYENTPQGIIDEAIRQAAEIEKYLKSWEKESGVNKLMKQSILQYCGWQTNDNLNKWLCSDSVALDLLDKWCIVLAREGWSIYDDFRKYETAESNEMKMRYMELAKAYKKRVKK